MFLEPDFEAFFESPSKPIFYKKPVQLFFAGHSSA